jgi:hypothetical protein
VIEPPTTFAPNMTAVRRWWLCRSCGARLGEIVGQSIVCLVKGREFSFNADAVVRTECPRCKVTNWRNAGGKTGA